MTYFIKIRDVIENTDFDAMILFPLEFYYYNLQSDICQLNVFNEFKEAETFILVTKSGPNPNPDPKPKPWSGTHFPNTILRLLEFSGLASRLPSSIFSLFFSPLLHITLISLTLSLSPSVCIVNGVTMAESFKL